MAKSTKRDAKRPASGAPRPAARHRAQMRRSYLPLAALGAVILLVALVRLRLLGVPFERDEGEYAYIGNLILHGGLPYRDAFTMKLPGTPLMYSIVIALFGSSPFAIHAGLLLVSEATIVLCYAAFRRLYSDVVAAVAVAIYGLLSISAPFDGFAAHATHFINLFVALGLFIYARNSERWTWRSAALVGLMFGLAFVMKQQALVLAAAVAGTELFSTSRGWRQKSAELGAYVAGAVVPYAVVVLVMVAGGAFDKFWFWTVTYARSYAGEQFRWAVARDTFPHSFNPMFAEYPVVWLLAGLGLAVVWLTRYAWKSKLFATLLTAASFAAICPGFYFREHYFVLLLPSVGLLAGLSLEWLAGLLSLLWRSPLVRRAPIVVIAVIGAVAVANGRSYYLDDDPRQVSRTVYQANPFVEAPEIASYVAAHTSAADSIGILGSEPEVLVYARRRSATRYIYTYPLLEPQPYNAAMQKEMIAEIEAAKPRYLLYYSVPMSWGGAAGSPLEIFTWFNSYAPANYDLVGRVDIPPDGAPTQYYWDAAAIPPPVAGMFSVFVLRRK